MLYEMCGSEKVYFWYPWNILLQGPSKDPYALVILNRPIDLNLESNIVWNLWSNASLRVTVDGGTDRWLSWLKLNNLENRSDVAPDLITGDFDSTSKDVINFFAKRNKQLKVIETADQNETDFTKSLREIQKHMKTTNMEIATSIVLCDTSGRFDQILANINTLYKAESILPDLWVLQLGSNSLTWLLGKGIHKISIPEKLRHNKEWCGLIPVGAPCQVTTTGLKWNLKNTRLQFGELVSTSNTYSGEEIVTIQTDRSIVWSMGLGLL